MKERILKRFDDDIAALERELKTELPKEIQRARELGDLRENAEYQAAKERQTLRVRRASPCSTRAPHEIALMNLERIPHDKAGFGSTVTLRETGGTQIIYQLVMPEDADAEKGLISTASPIGRALLEQGRGRRRQRHDAGRRAPVRDREAGDDSRRIGQPCPADLAPPTTSTRQSGRRPWSSVAPAPTAPITPASSRRCTTPVSKSISWPDGVSACSARSCRPSTARPRCGSRSASGIARRWPAPIGRPGATARSAWPCC